MKISNLQDLRVAKESFRYIVKLNEHALKLGANQFKENLKESAMKNMQRFTQKLIVLSISELLKRR